MDAYKEGDQMKHILTIGTGGTIASEQSVSGLTPELDASQLLRYVPQVNDLCTVDCMQPFSLDSTNITPEHWEILAALIEQNYNAYDGFVITHGTDTMAYTAAALSYLIQHSPKPIVLTGSQKPIVSDNTDSKQNLYDSFVCACSDMSGVVIVFNGKVILGTRARKTRTKSFQAFSSINYPELAYIRDGKVIEFIHPERHSEPVFFHKLNQKVALLKIIPGTSASLIRYLLQNNDGLVVESFGVGGVPSYEQSGFRDELRESMANGKTVVLTTQVENEGSDLSIYSVGSGLKTDPGVLEAYDMTTEAVVAKLMWILGQTNDRDEIRRLFNTPVANGLLITT